METDFNPKTPQSDPDWEYYGLLQDVHQGRRDLDETIKYIAGIESPGECSDILISQKLDAISDFLRNCVFERD